MVQTAPLAVTVLNTWGKHLVLACVCYTTGNHVVGIVSAVYLWSCTEHAAPNTTVIFSYPVQSLLLPQKLQTCLGLLAMVLPVVVAAAFISSTVKQKSFHNTWVWALHIVLFSREITLICNNLNHIEILLWVLLHLWCQVKFAWLLKETITGLGCW